MFVSNYRRAVVYITILLVIGDHTIAQIHRPQPGESIKANSIYDILWTPLEADFVNLYILNLDSLDLSAFGQPCDGVDSCALVANNVTNIGHFFWHVPADAPTSNLYYFELCVAECSENDFSGDFTVQGKRKGKHGMKSELMAIVSPGLIAAIVCAVLVAVLAIWIGICYFRRRTHVRKPEPTSPKRVEFAWRESQPPQSSYTPGRRMPNVSMETTTESRNLKV